MRVNTTTTNDPLSHVFEGHQIHQNASGPTAKSTVEEWFQDCKKHHHNLCAPPLRSKTPLPSRVIDVRTSPHKIVVTNGKLGHYTTLSYTWGGDQPYQLTPGNFQTYTHSGINLRSLPDVPLTIVDAIEITKLLDGIDYLWVDSLCIIQNDYKKTDFHTEGVKMKDYYGNSSLTICAAASQTAFTGIFNKRNVPDSTDIPYTLKNRDTGTLTIFTLDPSKENTLVSYLSLEWNPIVERAWTLQERVLSPRNIIYAKDQMYYECNTKFQAEAGFSVDGRQLSVDLNTQEISLFEKEKRNPRELWDVLVQVYGARKASHLEDKLVAFSGLAQKFHDLFRDDDGHDDGHDDVYIAGLWRKTFVQSLFWSTDNDPRPSWVSTWPPAAPLIYRAPSWSWACMDTKIYLADGRIYRSEPPSPRHYPTK